MDSLENNALVKKIIDFISSNRKLFTPFFNVLIFGSVIKGKSNPNDIDVLLVYKNFSKKIIDFSNQISLKLKNELNIYIDITLMNCQELSQTKFLDKIKKYLKII